MEGYMERYGKSFRVEHLKARWRQRIALLKHSSRGSCDRHWGISELPGAAGSLVLTFHLHCGVKCSSARALSAPTSSVLTSPLREHWLPKFPALGHSCRKGSSENPHQGPLTMLEKTSELPLLPQILSCATAMPYTFKSLTTDLILWFGPRPSPSPGLYPWSLGWGWSLSLLPFLLICSYLAQWGGTSPTCMASSSHFLLNSRSLPYFSADVYQLLLSHSLWFPWKGNWLCEPNSSHISLWRDPIFRQLKTRDTL